MKKQPDRPVITKILDESSQGHETRRSLFLKIEKEIGIPVVSFFTSFVYPVGIVDQDADMIEGVLQKMDLSKGFALFINSPGGVGLAAERIINVCRSYSGTGKFTAIVTGKAKSAATMVCFGAEKIIMGPTSELGPIDTQIHLRDNNVEKWFSAHGIVRSYRDLFERATNSKNRLEPYLQQLQRYDEREIYEFEMAIALSEDIAYKALSTGMMSGKTTKEIKKKINIFLMPETTKSHGRPISAIEAQNCCLTIDIKDVKSSFWLSAYELYLRTDRFVSASAVKCVESFDNSFIVGIERK